MNTIKECFQIILQGNREKSRNAARQVRKLLYGSKGIGKYKEIEQLVDSAPTGYDKISEDWRQENFVVAVSVIYYLHSRERQSDFLFPWLFQLLQHPNGVIRYAAVRMFSHEIGPLTYHIRFPGERSILRGSLKPEEADTILSSLFASLNNLLAALWQPKYKRYKYIDSLPASSYKSAQMVLAELKESCGQEYIDHLVKRCHFPPGDMETANGFGDDDFFDDCPVCQLMKSAQQEGHHPKTSELKSAFDEAKKKGAVVGGDLMEEDGLERIGNAKDFQMPEWMECTWRRIKCERDECPICGRIKQDRERHILRGEDPDSSEAVMEDVGESLYEALEMIKEHAEEMGLDIENIDGIQEPPEPKEFPLYLEVKNWRDAIFNMLEETDGRFDDESMLSDTVRDLAWYANLLPAKTYRQLCNRWHIENGDDYGKFDYEYTRYVITECLRIIEKSLEELSSRSLRESKPLLVPIQPVNFKENILKI